MKVMKIEIMVLDFDELGEEGIKNMLENTKYPNHALYPQVKNIKSVEIDWYDAHPLNRSESEDKAYADLFPD